MKEAPETGQGHIVSREKRYELDAQVSHASNVEFKQKKENGENTKGSFGMLLRVVAFGTSLDHIIQTLCAFTAICSGAAMPLMALVLGRLTANFTQFGSPHSQVSKDEFMQSVQTNSLWFIYLFIGKFTLVYIWSFGFNFTANRIVQALRLKCLDQILNRSVAKNDAETPGTLSNTITTHCNSIQAALSDRMGIMIQAFAMLLASFGVAFSQSWQLTLVMLGLVLITLGLIGFIVSSDQKIEAGLIQHYADCSGIAEDALRDVKTVMAFGAANKFLAKYDEILERAENHGKRRGPFVGLMFACQYFFMFIGWAIGFYLGTYLLSRGLISDPGRILAVFFAMLIGLGAIMALGPNMPSFIKAIAGASIVFKIFNDVESDEGDLEKGGFKLAICHGHIELRKVSFSYHDSEERTVLSDIDLRFIQGTSTAIVGPSGAGKSTLISLLERWYAPTAGTILLDGHDISKVDAKWLRSQIALVQQEPQLFNDSIFENIAHGLVGTEHEMASNEEKLKLVEEVCREARAYDFITKLPKGFHTIVGDRASLISGGQKQRIAIARALIGRRRILLMDEATSALDNENSKVIESLMGASKDRTTLFISHKIHTAKQANWIVVMDHGKVVEQGTHDELMHANGLYRRLYDTQHEFEAEYQASKATKTGAIQETLQLNESPTIAGPSADPGEIPGVQRRSLVGNLWMIAKEQKRFWAIFLTGVMACTVTAQIFPVQAILLGRVLQTFQGAAAELGSRSNFWSAMFLVVGFGALVSYAILGFFMTLLGMYLTRFYRLEYFRAVLSQRMEFFDRMASGIIVSRLSVDPSSLHDLISVNIGLLLSIFISIISGSIIALAYAWKLGLVTIFGAMPLVFTAGFIRMKLDSSLNDATAKLFEESACFASDALSAFRTVKAFTMENTVRQSYEHHLSLTIRKLYRQTAILTFFFAFSESVELLAAALTFWYGGSLLGNGEINTERFFTVFIAVVVGGQAAGALFGFSSNIGKAKTGANNILGLRDQVPKAETKDQSVAHEGQDIPNDLIVNLQNVTFAYPTRPDVPVLKEISLKVFRGQTVGVVGSSGSGKSTLLAVLERFYSTQSGTLDVFGRSISSYNIDEYRKRLAIVSQEPILFRGSVRDNVILGVDTSKTREADVVEACNAASISDYIVSLPEGYDSECGGVNGIVLSGGQKQRLAIARALIRRPEILLLDEPTSALDAESEQLVHDTLRHIQDGRTIILVTHRLHIARHADTIIFMSGGEIIERGTHTELMAQRGHYFKMYQSSLGEGM